MLPTAEEEWKDRKSYERKQQWAELLATPLLLCEMRELAKCNALVGLVNRESVYAKAVEPIIAKGLDSLDATEQHSTVWDSSVSFLLEQTAWQTIMLEVLQMGGEGGFTGRLSDNAFMEFARQHSHLIDALAQINLTLMDTLFDQYRPRVRGACLASFILLRVLRGALPC